MNQPVIAVLGLGIMGRGIALNYLKNGYEVVVWNRSENKSAELEQHGAKVASSPAQATAMASYIFDVTANDESSKDIFANEEYGIFTTATKEHILITCATLSMDWTKELSNLCVARELSFFDMPMTGSRAGAESGNLVLLVGGNKTHFEDVRKHLDAISCEQHYFGEATSGMAFKLCLNAIQAAHIIVFGQTMRQVEAMGLDTKAAGEFLVTRPGGLPTTAAWSAFQDFPEQPNFAVKWILKDLKYAREMLSKANDFVEISPSMLDVSIAVLQNAYDNGYGDDDWTIVNKL